MTFLTDNFLLQSEAAARLYHDYAASMPIIDYHCHLPPKDVAEDRRFSNITEAWLAGDHYKWRAMRAAGVDEHYITGNASDWEKFEKWAETTPKTLRNPLYHWTHLELRRPFGITNRLLSPGTAKSIWNDTNAKLQQQHFSARGIMRQMNVQLVCTTDDPADTLEHHQKIAADPNFGIKVLPTFRPDKAVNFLADDYHAYLDKLGAAAHLKIHTLDDLLVALYRRHDYFHEHGCRLSDHGFCRFFYKPVRQDIRTRSVRNLTAGDDWTDLQNAVLFHIAKWNAKKNWTMQLHIGAIRNNNSRMFVKLGADSGFDSIADHDGYAGHLGLFFDSLDVQGILPKTIVYNLNPSDNEMLCTMIGNFQTAETRMFPPKMQFGSGWWFLDQKEGIERQLNTLSNLGLLSGFVGMLTDSRSFLSYTRHEYFRRILCNLLGGEMEAGLLPGDFGMIGKLVQDICYNNAKNYFGF